MYESRLLTLNSLQSVLKRESESRVIKSMTRAFLTYTYTGIAEKTDPTLSPSPVDGVMSTGMLFALLLRF